MEWRRGEYEYTDAGGGGLHHISICDGRPYIREKLTNGEQQHIGAGSEKRECEWVS